MIAFLVPLNKSNYKKELPTRDNSLFTGEFPFY